MAQSKEMPLKPERYWFNKNLFKCAECRKTLDIIEHNYCPQCGQKIDWSEYPAETEEASSIETTEFEGTYYCIGCKETVLKTDKYCAHCGRPINWYKGEMV